MTININVPELRELKPRILVLGVGGAGGNAINGMIEAGLQGVEGGASSGELLRAAAGDNDYIVPRAGSPSRSRKKKTRLASPR